MRCKQWQNFTGKKAICEKTVATTEKTPTGRSPWRWSKWTGTIGASLDGRQREH